MEAQGNDWAWAVAGICFLVSIGTLVWSSRENGKRADMVKEIYREQQERSDKQLEATHKAMLDTSKALDQIVLTLRSLPEPLRQTVAPIAEKIDDLRQDVRDLNRSLDKPK